MDPFVGEEAVRLAKQIEPSGPNTYHADPLGDESTSGATDRQCFRIAVPYKHAQHFKKWKVAYSHSEDAVLWAAVGITHLHPKAQVSIDVMQIGSRTWVPYADGMTSGRPFRG